MHLPIFKHSLCLVKGVIEEGPVMENCSLSLALLIWEMLLRPRIDLGIS
jgi:hypothetical protein